MCVFRRRHGPRFRKYLRVQIRHLRNNSNKASCFTAEKQERNKLDLTTSFRVFFSFRLSAVSRKKGQIKKGFLLDKGGFRVGAQFLNGEGGLPLLLPQNHRQTIRRATGKKEQQNQVSPPVHESGLCGGRVTYLEIKTKEAYKFQIPLHKTVWENGAFQCRVFGVEEAKGRKAIIACRRCLMARKESKWGKNIIVLLISRPLYLEFSGKTRKGDAKCITQRLGQKEVSHQRKTSYVHPKYDPQFREEMKREEALTAAECKKWGIDLVSRAEKHSCGLQQKWVSHLFLLPSLLDKHLLW